MKEVIHLYRIARSYKNIRKGHKNEPRDPAMLMIFDNGFFTTVAGNGEIFHTFCKTKTLGNYTGKNYIVRKPGDAEYRHARLRLLPFDRCFYFRDEDVDSRKKFFWYLWFVKY